LIGPLASSPLTGCASSLALTPENILAAGLQSDTGQKALAQSKKRAREKAAKEEKKVKTPKTERGNDLNREDHTGQGTYTDTWVSNLSDQMTDGKMFEEPNDALSDTAGISPNAMGLEYGAEFDTLDYETFQQHAKIDKMMEILDEMGWRVEYRSIGQFVSLFRCP
jgi:IS5 family transposase